MHQERTIDPSEPLANGHATSPPPAISPWPAAELAQIFAAHPELLHDLFRVDPRDRRTVQEVVDAYLPEARTELGKKSYDDRARSLKWLAQELGTRLVNELTPLDLKRFIANRKAWASPYTRLRVNAEAQRCMNWAVTMRLIRANPFHGVTYRFEPRETGRDLTRDEIQAVLRNSDPAFRRAFIFLALSGCRPAELCSITWASIDWRRRIAVLRLHKTRKKTGKPRVIVLSPPALKLLLWIRRNQQGTPAQELRRLLENAPGGRARTSDVSRYMRALNFSYRSVAIARRKIGAAFERVGSNGDGHMVYSIRRPRGRRSPADASAKPEQVFLCSKGWPWRPHALAVQFRRLRRRLGLPREARLYGCRHRYITEAIRKNTNLKALSVLVGHTSTHMIESTYCHLQSDDAFIRKAALQAIGQEWASDYAPPLPEGETAPNEENKADAALRRAVVRCRKRRKPRPVRPRERVFYERHRVAYEAAQWAMAQNPDLARAADRHVFAWLSTRPEYAGLMPPTAGTFSRYLKEARYFLDGCTKQEKRRRGRPARVEMSLPSEKPSQNGSGSPISAQGDSQCAAKGGQVCDLNLSS